MENFQSTEPLQAKPAQDRTAMTGLNRLYQQLGQRLMTHCPKLVYAVLKAQLDFAPPKDKRRLLTLRAQVTKARYKAGHVDVEKLYDIAASATDPTSGWPKGKIINSHFSDACQKPMVKPVIAHVQNGQMIDATLAIFHNCPQKDIMVQQRPCTGLSLHSHFSLDIEIGSFSGDYLAVTYKLPSSFINSLSENQQIVITMNAHAAKKQTMFGRINILQNDRLYQDIQPFTLGLNKVNCTFDLADTFVAKNPAIQMWVELSFEELHTAQISLLDLGVYQKVT